MPRSCPHCGGTLTLSKEQCKAIYIADLPIGEIAKEAKVSRQTVYLIKSGKLHKKWTQKPDEPKLSRDPGPNTNPLLASIRDRRRG